MTLYTKALSEHPDDPKLEQNLERAKLRASAAHALEAARQMSTGDLNGALSELEIALTLNPTDSSVARQLQEIEALIAERGAEAERHSVEALKRQVRDAPFGRLQISPGATAPAGFVFQDASLRDVLMSLGMLADINVVFDTEFVDETVCLLFIHPGAPNLISLRSAGTMPA